MFNKKTNLFLMLISFVWAILDVVFYKLDSISDAFLFANLFGPVIVFILAFLDFTKEK